jgi:hypothetical protein
MIYDSYPSVVRVPTGTMDDDLKLASGALFTVDGAVVRV